MAIVGHGHAIDHMRSLTFDDGAFSVDWTHAFVANARNGDTTNGKMVGSNAGHLATMIGEVVQTDNVRHLDLLEFKIFRFSPERPSSVPARSRHTELVSTQWQRSDVSRPLVFAIILLPFRQEPRAFFLPP